MTFTANLVARVPVAHATCIGRVITRWAAVEWELQHTVYLLLAISPKQGRLAAKVPRAGECAALIKQLAHLQGITLNADTVKDLNRTILECVEWRDRLAHGVWLRQSKNPRIFLQVTKGAWNDPSGSGTNRKVLPEGMPITVAQLRDIIRKIEDLGERIYQLRMFLRNKLLPSHGKTAGQPDGRISLGLEPPEKPPLKS